jgi:hypothetical protein
MCERTALAVASLSLESPKVQEGKRKRGVLRLRRRGKTRACT